MNRLLSPPLLFRLLVLASVCLVIAGLALSAVSASNLSAYSVPWYTFDGGGGTSTGGAYTVMGTIGQPDAGQHAGSGYDLIGGFWSWIARYLGYLPLIQKP
jgi:hypothetical protein